jgi:hypothetical protein
VTECHRLTVLPHPAKTPFPEKITPKKVVHFAPESVVHFAPNSVVHFTPKYSNDEGIYVIVKGNFKIYYQIEPDLLIIILFWDCRQNPETINLKSNL